MTNKNLMYFVQTQVETLPACESNFKKSHFQRCTFGDDLGSKNYIYNNIPFLHYKNTFSQMLSLFIQLLCLG